jgi:DNA polymerase-4
VVLSREEACARFASSPPGLIPGIGPKTAQRLAELGLTTLAAVGGAPPELLVARFGPNLGAELGRRARFEHDGEVGAARKVLSESRERTFDTDVSDPGELRAALGRMAAELCRNLAANRRAGRTIGIKVRLDDFTTVTRARTVSEPTSDLALVSGVALGLLADYSPPRPVRLLGVRVAGLAGPDENTGGPAGQTGRAGPEATAGARAGEGQLALPV